MIVRRFSRATVTMMLLVPSVCFGWGGDGHMIVGQIAAERLSPQARAATRSMLGGRSLADVSNWADEIKSDRSYDWAKPLHYANVPPGAKGFELARDCPKAGCVVSAISRYIVILRDDSASASDRIQALKFLIHFVGDIHQPLHVGYAHDKGGNDVKVEFFYNRTDLHTLWDSLLIRRTKKYWKDYAEELSKAITPEKAAAWKKSADPSGWATETHRLAVQYAYAIPKDGQLGQEYFDRCMPAVDEQLSVAGVRLATLLNAVFADVKVISVTSAPAGVPSGEHKVMFVGSRRSQVYHYPGCPVVRQISPGNLVEYDSAPDGKRLHNDCRK